MCDGGDGGDAACAFAVLWALSTTLLLLPLLLMFRLPPLRIPRGARRCGAESRNVRRRTSEDEEGDDHDGIVEAEEEDVGDVAASVLAADTASAAVATTPSRVPPLGHG